MLFHSQGSECIRRENQERLLLKGGLPPILIAGMGWSLALRVYLLSVTAAFERVVDLTLHIFLQLNVRLGLGQDFTHMCDIVLQ